MKPELKVTNPPKFLSFRAYEDAIAEYSDRIRNLKGVLSLWTMGSVGCPGISDLDFVVLTEDDFDRKNAKYLSVENLDKRVLLHGPLVIPERLSDSLQWIIYATNLKRLFGYGELERVQDLSCAVETQLAAVYLVDFCESRMLQFAIAVTAASNGSSIDMRAWLTRTWSVLHSLNLAEEKLGFSIPSHIQRLSVEVRKPRENWKKGEPIDRSTFSAAFYAAKEVNYWCFLCGLRWLYGEMPKNISCGGAGLKFTGKSIGACEKYIEYNLRRIKILGRNLNKFVVRQDPRFLWHVKNYCQPKSLPGSAQYKQETQEVLALRACAVRSHWQWLIRHAQESNSMAGYLGYPRPEPLGARRFIRQMALMMA